jgi:hypothetical protein
MTGEEETRWIRDELLRRHGVAGHRLNDILFDEDPALVNFEVNIDEYEPEVWTILPRLRVCRSSEEVEQVLREELQEWFGDQALISTAKCQRIAQRVWTEVMPHLPPEPASVQAEVLVQRDALVEALTFLKRLGPMEEEVKLSSAGKALLIDGGRWKAEVPAVGVWPVVVTLRTDRLYEVLRLKRLLPETVVVAVADPYLRVHDWSLETETVTASEPLA